MGTDLQRGEVNDRVDLWVPLEYFGECDVVRHVGFVKRRSPTADELDAIERLFRRVI